MKLDRTLRVLEALAERPGPIGVVELGTLLGEPAPSLHRTLQTLIEHRLAVQEAATKRYRLGPGVLGLADAYRAQNRLVTVAQPVLDALRTKLHESVFVCELVDERAIVVAVAESPRPLRSFMRLGHRMPFHAAASAKAILAYQEPARIELMLERDGVDHYTDRTKTHTDVLMRELEQTRRRGYAVCDQELETGIKAVASPIRNSVDAVVASVAVIAPRDRLAGDRQAHAIQSLAEAATSISRHLGHRPPAPQPRAGGRPTQVGVKR